MADGRSLRALKVGGRGARDVVFSEDGSTVVGRLEAPDFSGQWGLALWSAGDGDLVAAAEELPGLSYNSEVHASADARRLLVRGGDVGPLLYSVADGNLTELQTPALASLDPTGLSTTALSLDGATILVGQSNGTVAVVEAGAARPARNLAVGQKAISMLAFSPTGTLAVVVDGAGSLSVWDLRDGGRGCA